jgi:p-cumate 2,3-dioxygenase beta subunit
MTATATTATATTATATTAATVRAATADADARLAALTRSEVEDLLYREAELLDDWELDDWLALYTDDARYVIPATDDPEGDPRENLVLVDDDRVRLRARVERLASRKAHREYPHSNVQHLVTNVRLGAVAGDELPVRAAFTVWRFRGGRETSYVGSYHYRLVMTEAGLRIRSKRVVLAMTTLRPANDVAIIL